MSIVERPLLAISNSTFSELRWLNAKSADQIALQRPLGKSLLKLATQLPNSCMVNSLLNPDGGDTLVPGNFSLVRIIDAAANWTIVQGFSLHGQRFDPGHQIVMCDDADASGFSNCQLLLANRLKDSRATNAGDPGGVRELVGNAVHVGLSWFDRNAVAIRRKKWRLHCPLKYPLNFWAKEEIWLFINSLQPLQEGRQIFLPGG
jgi:hypothetical protein